MTWSANVKRTWGDRGDGKVECIEFNDGDIWVWDDITKKYLPKRYVMDRRAAIIVDTSIHFDNVEHVARSADNGKPTEG